MSATHGAYLMFHLGGVRVVSLEILEFQEGTLRSFLALYGGFEVFDLVLSLYGRCQMVRNLVSLVVHSQPGLASYDRMYNLKRSIFSWIY